jgi:hypothetical protein
VLKQDIAEKERMHLYEKYKNEREYEMLKREIDLLKIRNIQHNKQPSVSSLSTSSTDIDKFNNEKERLVNELLEYKCKYAETKASLSEIEGEFRKLYQKIDVG